MFPFKNAFMITYIVHRCIVYSQFPHFYIVNLFLLLKSVPNQPHPALFPLSLKSTTKCCSCASKIDRLNSPFISLYLPLFLVLPVHVGAAFSKHIKLIGNQLQPIGNRKEQAIFFLFSSWGIVFLQKEKFLSWDLSCWYKWRQKWRCITCGQM